MADRTHIEALQAAAERQLLAYLAIADVLAQARAAAQPEDMPANVVRLADWRRTEPRVS